MMEYDVCVVGAGISGLIAANVLLEKGNKVLVLEKQNKVGGIAINKVKGRFEFKYPLLNLYIDNDKFPYSLNRIVDNDLEFVKLNDLFRVYSPKSDITVSSNKAKFKEILTSLAPDSVEVINTFFDLAYECKDAMNYIASNPYNFDMEFIKKEFNNFMRVSSYSVSQVMDSLGIPIFVQEIINSFWMLYGSSETSISFIDYATNLVNALDYGVKVPVEGSYGVAISLAERFLVMGGEIKLNSEVVNIIVEDNEVNGVKLADGKTIYCNRVVVNAGLDTVYGKLIKPEDAPRDALRNVNSREKGAKLFTVNLGLNRSIEDLGITNYLSFVYHSLDSDLEMEKMKEMGWRNLFVVVPNIVDRDASPEGTSIISLNTLFFDDVFSEYTDR
ncbi:MAG: NAD(P)/FAD-dependent oxidoreductase, partial [Bacilli bacterium]|nr:NAD(P)/FAD-dependent oxidoreductase [Bacilli bacterium]